MNRILLLFTLLLTLVTAEAQHWKAGVFLGGGFAQMTLRQNELNETVFVRQGGLFPTASFGFHGYVTESKDYPSRWFHLKKYVLIEASLCRCGGNIDLISTLPNGDRTFDQLSYIQYQGNYSVKFMFGTRNLKFFLGPNITSNFYSGVRVVKDDVIKSAKSQFNPVVIGGEGGVGLEFGKFMFTGRLRGYFTPYGSETTLIPTKFGNIQSLFVVYYSYIDKNKERNFKSIFWDK